MGEDEEEVAQAAGPRETLDGRLFSLQEENSTIFGEAQLGICFKKGLLEAHVEDLVVGGHWVVGSCWMRGGGGVAEILKFLLE